MVDFNVVIPARYESTRLPGKPLADIAGRPMIVWVHEQAVAAGAREVIVATDDERIVSACEAVGAKAEMTSTDHASGTDRIAELAHRLEWPEERIVVNVQGDEPLLPPLLVEQAAALLASKPEAAIATLLTPFQSEAEFHDPNAVKVVVDEAGFAVYFSRAPIPHPRRGGLPATARRHIGIYAYRVGALAKITAAGPSEVEMIEGLEQLRAIHLGFRIAVADAGVVPPRGVDTQADLDAIRRLVAGRGN